MSAAFERIYWLRPREHAALLTHAVCGDELYPSGHEGKWFSPTRVSRGERVLMLCYEREGLTIGLCAVAPLSLSVESVMRLREALSPRGGEAKWAPFVGQLGRLERVAATSHPLSWQEADMVCGGQRWRTRRSRHPSALIDRLMMRDRVAAEHSLLAAFCEWTDAFDQDVGDIPRCTPRVNVGDSRAE